MLGELEGVVPEGVKFYDISRARHDGTATGGGVHPSDSAVAAVAIEQSVVVNEEVGVLAAPDEVEHFLEQVAIHFVALGAAYVLAVLLDAPHGP